MTSVSGKYDWVGRVKALANKHEDVCGNDGGMLMDPLRTFRQVGVDPDGTSSFANRLGHFSLSTSPLGYGSRFTG